MQFSKSSKIVKLQNTRGWTDLDIQEVLDNPAITLPAIDYSKRGRPDEKATVYYRQDGYYVIRNDVTEEIIQISHRGDAAWYDEHRGSFVKPIP